MVHLKEAPANFVPAAAVYEGCKRCSDLLGVKRAQADNQVRCEIPGPNPGTASETDDLESHRG